MTAAEATSAIDPATVSKAAHDRAFLGHPKGLGYLAFVEGCERFSYYSMQTLLSLYMVNYLLQPTRIGHAIGLPELGAWLGLAGQPLASQIFGAYTSLVYLTPILGGIIADRWLGRRATLILGASVMALGHFLMAFESLFLFALACLVAGVGLFKGNIASQVGELYDEGDLRRATAFQIFYIAINVSVIVAPLISGTLGEDYGWHYGFGAAGVVMVIGLVLYLLAGPWLPPDNRPKADNPAARPDPLSGNDWVRVAGLLVLMPVLAVSLLTNQEIFNVYLVWADQHFQLTFFGKTLPTSWMITIDAAFSFSMLVAVAAFWIWYGRTRKEPDELGKMIIGSLFSMAGGMCLVIASATQGSGKIGLMWPVLFHLFNSIAFANILPVSLSLFSKVAPRQLNATVMGVYYFAFSIANFVVGQVGVLYASWSTTSFWLLHVASAAVGLVGFALFKALIGKRLDRTAPA